MSNRSESQDPPAKPSARTAQPRASEAQGKATKIEATQGVDIPLPTVGVHRVHISVPRVPAPPAAVSGLAQAAAAMPRAVRNNLPSRNTLLYYTGLGAAAALQVVSWPVAAAIGAGVWVASRTRTPTTADES
jgi:hypothetical protein